MPCYVNIALGNFFGHAFLFLRGGTALCFFILPLKNHSIKNKKAMCRNCTGTKSMTEKITEGHGVGRGKKDRGSFNKYL
jgi:hypothetical protein